MLHILLIILKIIGIIIAVILGLLLVLLAVLLCVPVRYHLEGTLDKEIKQSGGRGRVTWLLHLIRIDVAFQEQKLSWRFRIAWKSLGSEEEKEKPYEEDQKDKPEKSRKKKSKKTESEKVREKTYGNSEKEKKKEIPKKNPEPSGSSEVAEEDKKEKSHSKNDQKSQTVPEKTTTEKMDSNREEVTSEKTDQKNEDSGRFSKIKYTIQGICDKIKHIGEKIETTAKKASDIKERIVKELEDPVHQKAFAKVKKEIGKLLRRWKPKELKGSIHFGFEDPYHTGQALAVLSIIYPFIGGNLSVDPDFEQRILEGDIKAAGRIAMMPLVCLLWNLVWSKAVRQTYHDIRNFKI